MRVVAGVARGRRLVAPPGRDVRPTSDRVREAAFNALDHLGAVRGAHVLDLFAGSGALGVEALSRGADHAVFVDRDRAARRAIHDNLASVGFADRARVVAVDADRFLRRAATADDRFDRFDLVLLDPPYAFDDWAGLLDRLAPQVTDRGVVLAESDRSVPVPGWAELVRAKGYGGTVVSILRRNQPTPSET